jgi:ferric-dicitrate binding protein FerR (iron transport regulator)
MKYKHILRLILTCVLLAAGWALHAQSDLAASLEVLEGEVSIQRVNTEGFLPVRVEAIVGVGDTIRTGDKGRARITFFADGTDTELLPNTEYRISEFKGNNDSFQLTVEVLIGQTTQRLGRILDASSSYNIRTQGMTMAARGTVFAVRVEADGRAGMLVREGTVEAQGTKGDTARVPAEFGVRAVANATLSDVVRASTFAELDSALDGCAVTVTTPDDVSLNVRVSPNINAERIGTLNATEISTFFGKSETGNWYRVAFGEGYGWVLSSTATISGNCAGLRAFPNTHTEGDGSTPEAQAEATPEAGG